MASLNKVTLIGNIGKDPSIKQTANGKRLATFSLACSENWKDKSTKETKTKTEWVNIVIYNENIVNVIEKFTTKGSKIYIEGSLQTRKYEQDGVTKYTTEVVVQQFQGNIILLDNRNDSSPVKQAIADAGNSQLYDEIPF